MKLYKETSDHTSFHSCRYIFDFNVWYLMSISDTSRGSTQKEIFINQEIEYHIQSSVNYILQEIDMKEFPKKYQREFLEMIFSPERSSFFKKRNDETVPEVLKGRIIKH